MDTKTPDVAKKSNDRHLPASPVVWYFASLATGVAIMSILLLQIDLMDSSSIRLLFVAFTVVFGYTFFSLNSTSRQYQYIKNVLLEKETARFDDFARQRTTLHDVLSAMQSFRKNYDDRLAEDITGRSNLLIVIGLICTALYIVTQFGPLFAITHGFALVIPKVIQITPKAFATTAYGLACAVIVVAYGHILRRKLDQVVPVYDDSWVERWRRVAGSVQDMDHQKLAQVLATHFNENVIAKLGDVPAKMQELTKHIDSMLSNLTKNINIMGVETTQLQKGLVQAAQSANEFTSKSTQVLERIEKANRDVITLIQDLQKYQHAFQQKTDEIIKRLSDNLTKDSASIIETIRKTTSDQIERLFRALDEVLKNKTTAAVSEFVNKANEKLYALAENIKSETHKEMDALLEQLGPTLDRLRKGMKEAAEAVDKMGGALESSARDWGPHANSSAEALERFGLSIQEFSPKADGLKSAMLQMTEMLAKTIRSTEQDRQKIAAEIKTCCEDFDKVADGLGKQIASVKEVITEEKKRAMMAGEILAIIDSHSSARGGG